MSDIRSRFGSPGTNGHCAGYRDVDVVRRDLNHSEDLKYLKELEFMFTNSRNSSIEAAPHPALWYQNLVRSEEQPETRATSCAVLRWLVSEVLKKYSAIPDQDVLFFFESGWKLSCNTNEHSHSSKKPRTICDEFCVCFPSLKQLADFLQVHTESSCHRSCACFSASCDKFVADGTAKPLLAGHDSASAHIDLDILHLPPPHALFKCYEVWSNKQREVFGV